jgi:small subunit ribosomal protein S17
MEKKKTERKMEKEEKVAGAQKAECKDRDCLVHGRLKSRGKNFEGIVIKKFYRRIVIEFERQVYIKKYERYAKFRTKIHARLPVCMEDKIKLGDYVRVQECRPLSKIIHFVFIEKIKDGGATQ